MNRLLLMACSIALTACLLLVNDSSASAADYSRVNDTARFLAGLELPVSSPLAKYTGDAGWRRHAKSFDRAWESLDKRQLKRIHAWSKQNIAHNQKTLLYMFSGPDFLYADTFFPDASIYVLSALEPIGRLPDISRMPRGTRGAALARIRGTLQTVINYSFFRTKDMKRDLKGGKVAGTIPILLTFLARTGKTVYDLSYVSIDKQGGLNVRDSASVKGEVPGVRITFSNGDQKQKVLYYFSTDLSNGGVKKSGFLKFCKKLGKADSLIKSASYLLHRGAFSEVRTYLLDESMTHIQDDSGIPVRYFSSKVWELNPFGRYVRPISLFSQHYQPAMKKLFSRKKAESVDFGIGYRWRPRETNILLAIRK